MIIINKSNQPVLVNDVKKEVNNDAKNHKHPANAHNMLGKKFNDYVVTKEVGTDKSGHILWECTCKTCGKTFISTAYALTSGKKNTVCKHNNISLTPIKNIDNNDISDDKKKNHENSGMISDKIYYDVVKTDLLSMPVYFHIAHCIPADLTFYGSTASRINKLYNMQERLIDDYRDSSNGVLLHDVVLIGNVFNLFPNEKKHIKPTLNDIKEVVKELANYCFSLGVKYLAIPKFGCGNGLDWNDVDNIIKNAFFEAYDNKEEAEPIHIVVCEQ